MFFSQSEVPKPTKFILQIEEEIKNKKATLHILYGDLEDCFLKLKKEFPDWSDIYINRDERGYGLERDKIASAIFKEIGVKAHGYDDHHIHSAREIKTGSGTHYKVFTPYFNKWIELQKPEVVNVIFDKEKVIKGPLFLKDEAKFNRFLAKQVPIEEVHLGHSIAHERLDEFIKQNLSDYNKARDYPLKNATSHLSKHLRTGEISIRTVFDHIRLRMVTASFLTKDLLIDWRWGEQYFQEMLIDYDPASNIGGWQWAASTGTDSVPYFRIFNPTTQSEKYDKNGDFIKKYIPELRNISSLKIHDPSTLSEKEQNEFQVFIGKDYPEPIVSHKERRKLAIKTFEDCKKDNV